MHRLDFPILELKNISLASRSPENRRAIKSQAQSLRKLCGRVTKEADLFYCELQGPPFRICCLITYARAASGIERCSPSLRDKRVVHSNHENIAGALELRVLDVAWDMGV